MSTSRLEETADARRIEDPLGGLLALLRADVRLAGHRFAKPHPLVISVRGEGQHQVLLTPGALIDRARSVLAPFARSLVADQTALVLVGSPSRRGVDAAVGKGLAAILPLAPSADELFVGIHGAFALLGARERAERRGEWVTRYRNEIGEFAEIARALTTERKIDRLLELILEKGRAITGAEAGSIYVVEGDAADISDRFLRFKYTQNDAVSFDAREFRVPISERSMSGYVALRTTILNIADVYNLPEGAPYGFDPTFDRTIGYRTRSMLCAPLTSRNGEVIGVLQLINCRLRKSGEFALDLERSTEPVPFDSRGESLLTTLASLAGVSLENAILAAENEKMLEGFVRASVEAIEQRDPTTSGHSIRVARMSLALARAVERCDSGVYRDVRWSADDLRELEYASLLHDFGKIGVREQVLVKAKKLYPFELDSIHARFALARRSLDVEQLERTVVLMKSSAPPEALDELEVEFAARRAELDAALSKVCHCNEPTVLKGGDFAAIEELSTRSFRDERGIERPLLTAQEVASLSVARGSLTSEEFAEIRSHVEHTFKFLSAIPWGRKLRHVADIAVSHHERLDGTGYPHGLHAPAIPLQSKIMAVSDIFDALTAADRPYKRAVPLERALTILDMEVKDRHIDGELVRIFSESQAWTSLDQKLD